MVAYHGATIVVVIGKQGGVMQITKTLWMLDYRTEGCCHLIPIYAVDEQGAWVEAYRWATQHGVPLPEDAMLIHYPNGFTVHMSELPGCAEE